jgi:zinc protease
MQVLNRTIAPPFHPITSINLLRAETRYLKNGIPLHTLQAGEQLVLGIEIIFQAGTWYEPSRGVSYFTSKMMSEGTHKMSGPEIMEHISTYGAFMEVSHSLDHVGISVYCLSRYLKEVLPVVNEMITEASLPEEELENLRRITLQTQKVNMKKTSYRASMRFRELLFGTDNPYGTALVAQDIKAIERDALWGYYQQMIAKGDCEVILSGQFTDEHIHLVDNLLGALEVNKDPIVKTATAPAVNSVKEKVGVQDAVQATLRIGRRTFTRQHPDYIPMKVLNEILGGYFGSRLMRNIREEKGYTYGIHSSLAAMQQDGYMVIGTDINRDVVQQTIDEVYKEMDILCKEPVQADELDTVRNYMLGSFANSITTPFALADKFKSIHFSGMSYDYYDKLIHTYATITADELQALAQKYYQPEAMTVVVAEAPDA